MNALAWVGRHATAALAIGVVLGLIVPGSSDLLPPFLPALIFAFTTASFLKVDLAPFRRMVRRPALPFFLMAWVLVISPLAVGLTLIQLPLNRDLLLALIVWAVSPPMTAAIVFSAILRLDVSLAAGGCLAGMLIVPFTGPLLSLSLVDLPINLDPFHSVFRVLVFVSSSALFALLIRARIGARKLAEIDSELSGLTVIILLLYAMAIMSDVRSAVLIDPLAAAYYVTVAYAANFGVQLLTGILFVFSGAKFAATSALLAGNRNMGVLYANMGSLVTPELKLFFAAIHIPIYTSPYFLKPLYSKFFSDAEETARI